MTNIISDELGSKLTISEEQSRALKYIVSQDVGSLDLRKLTQVATKLSKSRMLLRCVIVGHGGEHGRQVMLMVGRISTDRLAPAKSKDKQLCLGGRDPQPLQYLGVGQRPVPCVITLYSLLTSLTSEEDTSSTDYEETRGLVLLDRQNKRGETRQKSRKHDRFEGQDLEVNVNSRVPE